MKDAIEMQCTLCAQWHTQAEYEKGHSVTEIPIGGSREEQERFIVQGITIYHKPMLFVHALVHQQLIAATESVPGEQ